MRVIARNRLKAEKGIFYSDVHLLRMEKKGQFPKSFKLGPGRVAYDEAEIDEWLKQRRNADRSGSGNGAAAA